MTAATIIVGESEVVYVAVSDPMSAEDWTTAQEFCWCDTLDVTVSELLRDLELCDSMSRSSKLIVIIITRSSATA